MRAVVVTIARKVGAERRAMKFTEPYYFSSCVSCYYEYFIYSEKMAELLDFKSANYVLICGLVGAAEIKNFQSDC